MNLEMLTHDALAPFRHGFFTRKGGASSGIYAGLNCGVGSADQADIVTLNKARVAAAMGVDTRALSTLSQHHSPDVAVISAPVDGLRHRADAQVTATPGVALAVLTADCQPVLFADPQARVIGAAHAGWQGAIGGVLEATIDAMEGLGATRAAIRCVIGPSISQRSYEVGPEFMDRFLADDPANGRFFAQGTGDKVMFDLPAYGISRLRRSGVGLADWTRHCTYCDPERFYSYRRSVHRGEPDYGRLISAITI